MADMTNKAALVIGGASGIGLAIAERLAADGAAVFLTGRREADVAAAAEQAGATGIVADAADPEDLARAVAAVADTHGLIDALVLNAGISEAATLAETTPELIDRHFAVNVRAAAIAMRAAAPVLADGAAVLLVGSTADMMGLPPYATYAATKAALRSYARSWAAELAPRGIRVNIVNPGPTDTAMFATVPDEGRAALTAQVPLGRMARPAEIAGAAAFLLGSDASYVTGTALYVDGGMKQV